MPRNENRWPQNPAHTIQERTVSAAVQAVARTFPRVRSYEPQVSAPVSATSPLELEDGTIVTRHDFMLGYDTLGDRQAALKVNGKRIDYTN